MIQLITRRNSQGYLATYVLKYLYPNKEVSVIYQDDYSLSSGDTRFDPQAEIIILFNIPYQVNQHSAVVERLSERANPFSLLIHVCTFGETIQMPYVESIVTEVDSPLLKLFNYLEQLQLSDFGKQVALFERPTATVLEFVLIADDYHRQDFSIKRALHPLQLQDLTYHWRDWTHSFIGTHSPVEVKNTYQDTLTLLEDARVTYVRERIRLAQTQMVKDIFVVLVYAETHQNEIGHWLIENSLSAGVQKIVVLIGRMTRGDHIFTVYTKGLHAGDLAKHLNGGGGKEEIASVFLGNPSKALLQGVASVLESFPNP